MNKKIPALALGLSLFFAVAACGTTTPSDESKNNDGEKKITGTYEVSADLDNGFLRTAGTDDFGRSFEQVSGYNDNVVGVFYFLWASQAGTAVNVESYEQNGEIEKTLTGEEVKYGPNFTFWGEPMYGYYQIEDEWVVRKHVELFINAGLDFICFDTTNNDYYAPAALTVLNVLLEYQKLGYKVPKAMFMTNSDSTGRTTEIYNAFYKRGKYDSVWFKGNADKPWIISSYAGDNQAILDTFYFKAAQWPNATYNQNKFPWISWRYPQETFTDDANDYTIMNVSASQHTGIGGGYSDAKIGGINFSLSGLFAPHNYDSLSDTLKSKVSKEQATKYYNANRGRGWSNVTNTNTYENAVKNTNFEEQWDSVWKNRDVNLVFITGWNEWMAQKQSKDPLLGDSYGYFVDTFDMEFSRDIEMMNGGYLDNCFIQMVKNVRKFKGVGHNDITYESYVDKDMLDLANWKDVTSYADLTGDTKHRDHQGAGTTYYKNDTGRNDIKEVRIAADSDNVTSIEALGTNADGGILATTLDFDADIYTEGKFVSYRIPLEALGVTSASEIGIKVSDNIFAGTKTETNDGVGVYSFGDIFAFYCGGDCAPAGRLNYTYRMGY